MSTVYSVLKIQKELNAHIAAAYVRFQFTCRYCKRQYASANGCAKHEKSHGGYNFECEFCHKKFLFPGALSYRRKVHTCKKLYPCINCDLKFTTNRAMLCHAIKHQGKIYSCNKCAKKCDSPYNLVQHIKGYHGDGWLMMCGEREQWPLLVQKHKQKCKTCKLLPAKKERKHLRRVAKICHRKNRSCQDTSQEKIGLDSPVSTLKVIGLSALFIFIFFFIYGLPVWHPIFFGLSFLSEQIHSNCMTKCTVFIQKKKTRL